MLYLVIVTSMPSTVINLRLGTYFIQKVAAFDVSVETSKNAFRHIVLQFLINNQCSFIKLPRHMNTF